MFIRTKDGILDMDNTKECIYVIRDTSIKKSEFRYVSYHWDNWKNYYLIDYQNCTLFSYNSAQNFISDLMKENLKYQNLVIELSPYYKDYNQSDNLAELIDAYVFVSKFGETHYIYGFDYDMGVKTSGSRIENDETFRKHLLENGAIYGVIWCEWGLKYVAKMNDEGEFELL